MKRILNRFVRKIKVSRINKRRYGSTNDNGVWDMNDIKMWGEELGNIKSLQNRIHPSNT